MHDCFGKTVALLIGQDALRWQRSNKATMKFTADDSERIW